MMIDLAARADVRFFTLKETAFGRSFCCWLKSEAPTYGYDQVITTELSSTVW
jgi:hypothetical protein